MAETSVQKFTKHFKKNGLFYAIKRGFRYILWRGKCVRMRIDWRKFSK